MITVFEIKVHLVKPMFKGKLNASFSRLQQIAFDECGIKLEYITNKHRSTLFNIAYR